MKKFLICLITVMSMCCTVFAQQDVSKMTKDEIMQLSYDDLLAMPFDDLLVLANKLGVSTDELFKLIMNKNVSSASKAEESSFTSPLSSTVITKDEIRTYGITTIEEALRLIPGMIVQEKTNGIYDIHMRGLNNIPDNNMLLYTENANTLVMVDGRQIQNAVMGAITFEMIPISIEDVERIEVVRGACGALYGANAVSGVINIITEKPNPQSSIVSGNIQAGNNNTYIGDIGLRKSLGNGKISAGLTFNFQQRGRNTDKMYVIPSADLVLAANPQTAAMTSAARVYGDPNNGYLTMVGTGARFNIGDEIELNMGDRLLSIDDIQNTRQLRLTQIPFQAIGMADQEAQIRAEQGDNVAIYHLYNAVEPETPVSGMFHDTEISRKTMGANGYISFVPNNNIRFDISGGYGLSQAMSSPMRDNVMALNERDSKTGYVNLNSRIYGLTLNYGFECGPQDYAYGVPGMKLHHNIMNGNAEYTFKIDNLSIKPAFDFQWAKYSDYLPVFNDSAYQESGNYTWHYEGDADVPADSYTRLYGFLNGSATLYAIAPSLRLDYKVGGLRLIGAFRTDKTNIPDKWNHSWQLAASYEINESNFVRVVYGRANRGASLINTNANYQWICTNMQPQRMIFEGNKNADLVKIDNVELGYRWKPTESILVDAELFFSHSTDYGALMSSETMMATSLSNVYGIIGPVMGQYRNMQAQGAPQEAINNARAGAAGNLQLESRSYAKYNNLPYKVNQLGLSVNLDWIISPKLIAKVNLNLQQTTINDYYVYSQNQQILQQMSMAQSTTQKSLYGTDGVVSEGIDTYIKYGNGADMQEFFGNLFKPIPIDDFKAENDWNNIDANAQTELLTKLYNAGINGENYGELENPLSMYFALKYNVLLKDNDVYFGSTYAAPYQLSDGHKHKSTPSVYGMIGFIYKPITKLTISTFGNYIGKRTYNTQYSSSTLSDRFTLNLKVGYKPIETIEVFANAHNLFNSEKQEFVYTDKIGGLYTFGINFNF